MVHSMDRWVGKVAVVTGASSGIGEAIATQLVEEGLKVVGLARRKDRLNTLTKKLSGKSGQFYGVKADMSKEEDILKAFKWVSEKVGPIHILVNNAGVCPPTNLIDGNIDMWKQCLDINVLGLCIATREALRIMKSEDITGHIVHINSVTGHQAVNVPGMNVYPASKHAATALTETLRVELNLLGSKTKITSVSPGGVLTEVWTTSNNIDAKVLKMMPFLQSEDVADAVVYALSTPPHVQIHELTITPINEPV